ncbi:hypothetical protein KCU77_g3224, partial [Aureobasidium melanogenum]
MISKESSNPPPTSEPIVDSTESDKAGPSRHKRNAGSLDNDPATKRQKVVRFPARPVHLSHGSNDSNKVEAPMSAPYWSDQALQGPFGNPGPARELLVNYLQRRLFNLSNSLDDFSDDFAAAIQSRFEVLLSNDCGSYIDPSQMHNARAEWERAYRQEKHIEITTSHGSLKVRSLKDAQFALTIKEDCKHKRAKVSRDQKFFEEWKRKWEEAVIREAGDIFDQMIEFFEAQEKVLFDTGSAMFHQVSPWSSRMR